MRLVQVIVSTVATRQLSPALTTAEAEETSGPGSGDPGMREQRECRHTSTTSPGHAALWDLRQRFGEQK